MRIQCSGIAAASCEDSVFSVQPTRQLHLGCAHLARCLSGKTSRNVQQDAQSTPGARQQRYHIGAPACHDEVQHARSRSITLARCQWSQRLSRSPFSHRTGCISAGMGQVIRLLRQGCDLRVIRVRLFNQLDELPTGEFSWLLLCSQGIRHQITILLELAARLKKRRSAKWSTIKTCTADLRQAGHFVVRSHSCSHAGIYLSSYV